MKFAPFALVAVLVGATPTLAETSADRLKSNGAGSTLMPRPAGAAPAGRYRAR